MSLIGWWPLHRTQGKALDMSGNGNHGTHNGTTRGVAGIGGLQATSFDGSDDYISLGSNFPSGLSSFTVAAWVRVDDFSSPSKVVARGGPSDDTTFNFAVRSGEFFPKGSVDFYIQADSTSHRIVTDQGAFDKNDWGHITVKYDNSKIYVYINGSLEAFDSASGLVDTTTENTSIGRIEDKGYLSGKISDVRFYDRALSSSEIQTLYEWGSRTGVTDARLHNGRDPGAVARYTLDGSAEDVWGPNNGTNNGATYVNNSIRGQAGSFDGSEGDYVSIASTSATRGDEGITVSAWAKPETLEGTDRIVSRDRSEWWSLGEKGEGFRWEVADNNGVITTITTTEADVATGNWYHVVGTWESSTGNMFLYKNAVAVSKASSSTLGTGVERPVGIGANVESTVGGGYWNGLIDDVRIYDRALSPSEVHQLYQWGTRGIDMRRKLVNKR